MQRRSFFIGLFVVLPLVLPTATAVAQLTTFRPADRLSEYRFLPRHSILDVEGGFAGFDIQANIHGTFSLVNGFRGDCLVCGIDAFAKFREVDAVAINPADFGPYSFDLDETLNLTGLEGFPLPVAAPFDVLRFVGEDGQGARMNLTVIQFGRWLYMRGANEAPCCDFFDYEIEAIARRTPFADFNNDDRVDHRDLTAWANRFGDNSGDNDPDGGDFLNWQRQLGETMPAMETFAAVAALSSAQAALSAIPEPNSLALLAGACLLSMTLRRRPLKQ